MTAPNVDIPARLPGTNRMVAPWEVATMMRRAGFPTKELVIGVAVVGAESGYQVDADNGSHVGLFQIADDKGFDRARLKSDAQYNVNAAYQVWLRQGWRRGWLNYENGSSYKFLGSAAAAVATSRKNVPDTKLKGWTVHSNDISAAHEVIGAVPGGDSAYTAVQSAGSATFDLVGKLGQLDTWVRGGEIVAGSVMFIAGLILLARSNF